MSLAAEPLADDDVPGPEAHAQGPQRRCLVTGEERPKADLVRFVVGPDGDVVPDIDGRLPGRGLWTLSRRDIVAAGVARRLFARAARRPVRVDPQLADGVERLLARRCIDGLGLARRAGQAVAGFEKVRSLVERGRCGLLIVAAGAGQEGQRKLAAGAARTSAGVLRDEEVGVAFAREATVYAAVESGPLAERLAGDLDRLAGFRSAAAGSGEPHST